MQLLGMSNEERFTPAYVSSVIDALTTADRVYSLSVTHLQTIPSPYLHMFLQNIQVADRVIDSIVSESEDSDVTVIILLKHLMYVMHAFGILH